ncbi:MAG: hypothetical protein PVJ57_17745 [Phycisphaerae bacterium]|jgi:hypothetical protein
MSTGTLQLTGHIAGIGLGGEAKRTADAHLGLDPTLPAAKSGTLSTRTSDTAGTLTLSTGHGFAEGDVVDIYWTGGCCYGAEVGVVVGNDVPFTGAAGDVLPPESATITVQEQQVHNIDFVGDLAVAIAAHCSQKSQLLFWANSSVVLAIPLAAGEPWFWLDGQTAANPLASETITHVTITQGGTEAAMFRAGVLYDSAG